LVPLLREGRVGISDKLDFIVGHAERLAYSGADQGG
jgi:hypothetical protein